MTSSLIEALLKPTAYKHPVDYLKLLETHISWVILTGKYAYKIKKPVDFGFINYATLEKRHYYCEQEILLNHALAAQIYCQVLPVVETTQGYLIDGQGEAVEYVVQMKEFSQEQLLSYILPQQGLTPFIIDDIAIQLAHFHMQAAPVLDMPFGTAAIINQFTAQNFSQASELLKNDQDLHQLQTLEKKQPHIDAILEQRKKCGFIRSCHGDLHLGNITLIDEKPVIFDRIEFNDDLRYTDVMADVGFLIMDFYDHKKPDYAMQFLNTYLAYTSDYAGLAVLPYYFAYRAMVRAKIQLFNIQSDTSRTSLYYAKYKNYVNLALDYLENKKPYLLMMHGFSGSGKSTVARHVSHTLGAIVVQSEIERRRLFNLQPTENSHSVVDGELYQKMYHPEVTQRTYLQLKSQAKIIIEAGYPVIIDATCLTQWQRQLFIDLAHKISVPYVILDCQATLPELTARLENADQNTRFFSEANVKIMQSQEKINEPLTEIEIANTFTVTANQSSMTALCKTLQERFHV